MANEHVLMTQKTFPISMTCANATGIEKGTVLAMSDANTAGVAGVSSVVAGIAYTEKIANDGNTQIAVLSGPGDELRGYASGNIAIGDTLMTAAGDGGFNFLRKATAGLSGGHVIGISKEAAAAGETFKYVLQIGASS